MRIRYTDRALRLLATAPLQVNKAFYKQVQLLKQDIRYPSLHAKKYIERENIWQARVNRDWRFYFSIDGDIYIIHLLIKHPK